MVDLASLWLPIIVSAVVIFFASFLAWTVLPHHKTEWKNLPDEDGFFKALADLGVKPGQFMFPHCGGGGGHKDPEFQKKWEAGPWGSVCLWAKPPNFARNLILVFIFYLVVGLFVGYLGRLALPADPDFRMVFRFTGTAAVMAYTLGSIPHSIFFGATAHSFWSNLIDGIVYGLLTGVVFALLWPSAEAAMEMPAGPTI
jgi:hypothetical protein